MASMPMKLGCSSRHELHLTLNIQLKLSPTGLTAGVCLVVSVSVRVRQGQRERERDGRSVTFSRVALIWTASFCGRVGLGA